MIKMTNELFEKFATKQEELDSMIREKFNIEEKDWYFGVGASHTLALNVEIAEFINNCHDAWKYWKQKPVNPGMIIEEAVDVIHFLHLSLNKSKYSTDYLVDEINEMVDGFKEYVEPISQGLLIMTEANKYTEIYAALIYVLDHYGFTLDDIEQAYDKKNKENHTRQANNY